MLAAANRLLALRRGEPLCPSAWREYAGASVRDGGLLLLAALAVGVLSPHGLVAGVAQFQETLRVTIVLLVLATLAGAFCRADAWRCFLLRALLIGVAAAAALAVTVWWLWMAT